MKVLKKAYFRTTPKTTQFWDLKMAAFSGPPKTVLFSAQKRGLIFGPKKRPKNGRFLGLEKAAYFRHRRH